MARYRFGQALACHDSQMRGIVLQNDEHDCRQGHNPQEAIAKLGAGSHIRCPVSGINKTYRYEQAGANRSQYVEPSGVSGVARPKQASMQLAAYF